MSLLKSILTTDDKVRIVGNDTLPNKPLITPHMHKDGKPKTDNNMNPLGSIRFEQRTVKINNGSFANESKAVAFLSGTIEFLEKVIRVNSLTDGSEVPGRVVVYESLQPFYKGQQPKINPTTKDPVLLEVRGQKYPVFYRAVYDETGMLRDELIRSSDAAMKWIDAREVEADANAQGAGVVETSGIPATETQKTN